MILKRIYLENFLAHSKSEIIFPDSGITVFIGENGAGKSSILEGISFALFGKTTRGNLQDVIQWGRTGSKVELEFQKGNNLYKIERTVVQKGKKTVSTGTVFLKKGGRFLPYYQKNISKEIPKIIGMTLKSFFSSVVIRQGEIEDLVEMKPRERAKLFEEILDMTLYQLISDTAGEKRRSLEAVNKGYEATLPDLEEIKKEVKYYEEKKKNREKEKIKIEKERDQLEKKLDKIKKDVETLRREWERLLKVQYEIKVIESNIETYKKNITDKYNELKLIKEKEKEIGDLKPLVSKYDELERKIEKLQNLKLKKEQLKSLNEKIIQYKEYKKIFEELKGFSADYEEKNKESKKIDEKLKEFSRLKGEIDTLNKRIEELREVIKDTQSSAIEIAQKIIEKKSIYKILIHNPVAVNQFLENCEHDIKKIQEELKDVIKEKAQVEAEGKELRKRKEGIGSIEGNCPTCDRPLDEHTKDELIKDIDKRLSFLRKKYRELKDKEKKLNSELELQNSINLELQKFKEFFVKHKDADHELQKIKGKIFILNRKLEKENELVKKKKELEEFLEKEKEKIILYYEAEKFIKRSDIDKLESEKKRLEEEINKINVEVGGESIETLKNQFEKLKDVKEKYIKLKENISQKDKIEDFIRKSKDEISILEEKLKKLNDLCKDSKEVEEKIKILERDADDLENHIKKLNKEIISVEREISELNGYIEVKIGELKKGEEIKEKIKKNLEKIEKYKKIETALGKEGIQKIIRDSALYELPKITGNIFSIFGFPFEQVKFDDNFDISLLATTVERNDRYINVNAVSGGQRTALGIALRLAIGRFLSSKTDFLILDEPTVHLDEQRRSDLINLLLELKRKNFVKQLIIVTHDTEVEDAADNIYYVNGGVVKSID
ncbi:AAA family ATPase [Persephonella sp.]